MSTWSTLPAGVLNDAAIHSCNQHLFTSGFTANGVKQCCYEFRVGDSVIDLSRNEADRIVDVKPDCSVLIAPRCTVVVKVAEAIRVPKDCLVKFLLKGKFFSLGIVPVNTYADPGFSGHMGAVLTNVSNDYVQIPFNEPFLKAEFVKLPSPVDVGYEGQHGFGTGHWPILQQYRAKPDQIRKHGVDVHSSSEIRRVYGDAVADAVSRLRYYSVAVWVQLAIVTAFLCGVLAIVDNLGGGWALALGIFGNAVASLLMAVARKWLPEALRGEL